MAQLRDAKTSELILEGTPLELALMAEELGRDDVLFDDVTPAFDAEAVIAHHREQVVEPLGAAARAAKGAQKTALADAQKEAAGKLELDAARVAEATANLEAARARLEG